MEQLYIIFLVQNMLYRCSAYAYYQSFEYILSCCVLRFRFFVVSNIIIYHIIKLTYLKLSTVTYFQILENQLIAINKMPNEINGFQTEFITSSYKSRSGKPRDFVWEGIKVGLAAIKNGCYLQMNLFRKLSTLHTWNSRFVVPRY